MGARGGGGPGRRGSAGRRQRDARVVRRALLERERRHVDGAVGEPGQALLGQRSRRRACSTRGDGECEPTGAGAARRPPRPAPPAARSPGSAGAAASGGGAGRGAGAACSGSSCAACSNASSSRSSSSSASSSTSSAVPPGAAAGGAIRSGMSSVSWSMTTCVCGGCAGARTPENWGARSGVRFSFFFSNSKRLDAPVVLTRDARKLVTCFAA